MGNKNLNKARSRKNDEFFTRIYDIEMELKHYIDQFEGKVVYCNCDDPKFDVELGEVNPKGSNFWNFFFLQFHRLGLEKLVATGYKEGSRGVKYEYDGNEVVYTELEGDGDFRSEECLDILSNSDVVCTNPPFSLFREYINLLVEHGVEFLVIGNSNIVATNEIFPLIREDIMWYGNTKPKEFIVEGGGTKKFGNIVWFTNLRVDKRYEDIILYKEYEAEEYPEFDYYNAINVDRVCRIPKDFGGAMGVPISFLDKYNPDQFEILDANRFIKPGFGVREKPHGLIKDGDGKVCGVTKYVRVLIRHKREH